VVCSLSVVEGNWLVHAIVVFPEKKQGQYTEGIVLSRREIYAHLALAHPLLIADQKLNKIRQKRKKHRRHSV